MTDETTRSTSESDSETDTPERRRTVLIWLVLAFMCFSVLNSLYAVAAIWLDLKDTGIPTTSSAFIPLFVVSAGVDFAAGLAVFNLRAAAVRLVAIGLAISVVVTLYWLVEVRPEDFGYVSGIPFFMTLLIATMAGVPLVIYGAILAFVLRLRRKGILR